MTEIRYVNYRTNTAVELDFGDLVAFVKGSSITSLAVSDNFVEFGLSDAYNLRIDVGGAITLVSTTNNDESEPLRLKIVGGEETPTAALVEQRLHALRQIYAMSFLLDAGREDAIAKAFSLRGTVDLESVLEEEDKLLVKSASTGSFWLTVAAKSAAAWNTLKGIGPLFFDEGRQAIVDRARATTELKQIEVDRTRFDTALHKANCLIDLYKKIEKVKDPQVKGRLLLDLNENIKNAGNTPLTLPSPPSQNTNKA